MDLFVGTIGPFPNPTSITRSPLSRCTRSFGLHSHTTTTFQYLTVWTNRDSAIAHFSAYKVAFRHCENQAACSLHCRPLTDRLSVNSLLRAATHDSVPHFDGSRSILDMPVTPLQRTLWKSTQSVRTLPPTAQAHTGKSSLRNST
jgi:hypothetical protein